MNCFALFLTWKAAMVTRRPSPVIRVFTSSLSTVATSRGMSWYLFTSTPREQSGERYL